MNTMHVIDTTGCTHTMALSPNGVLLDEKPCLLFVQDSQMKLVSSDPTIGMITIFPAALWHAYAGGDPAPEAAGVILAELLARHAAMHKIAELTWRMQPLFDEIDLHLHQHQELPEPSFRFSPFVAQCLATLDGTEEQTLAVARILKQSPQTITGWGAQMGKSVSGADHAPLTTQDHRTSASPEHEDDGSIVHSAASSDPEIEQSASPASDGRRGKRGFSWTEDHARLLEEAVQVSQQPSTNAMIKEISSRFGWPFHVVDYRMRQLAKRTPPSQPEDQAEGEPTPNTRTLGDAPSPGPLRLPVGAFLWDVKLDGNVQRWQLDIAYGMFPHAPGAYVLYREEEYLLQRAWHSIIEVTPVVAASSEKPAVMELAEV